MKGMLNEISWRGALMASEQEYHRPHANHVALRSLDDPRVRARIDEAEQRIRSDSNDPDAPTMSIEELGRLIDDARAGRPIEKPLEDPGS
jgi:hypothetical protein